MHFIYLIKNIQVGAFFVMKCPYMPKYKVLQNYKNPSLVDFHSLYQLLHSQVSCNGLKL